MLEKIVVLNSFRRCTEQIIKNTGKILEFSHNVFLTQVSLCIALTNTDACMRVNACMCWCMHAVHACELRDTFIAMWFARHQAEEGHFVPLFPPVHLFLDGICIVLVRKGVFRPVPQPHTWTCA